MTIGSLAYLSPEQVRGEPVTPAAMCTPLGSWCWTERRAYAGTPTEAARTLDALARGHDRDAVLIETESPAATSTQAVDVTVQWTQSTSTEPRGPGPLAVALHRAVLHEHRQPELVDLRHGAAVGRLRRHEGQGEPDTVKVTFEERLA